MYLGFPIFVFLKKQETTSKRESERPLLSQHNAKRESSSTPTQNRINTRDVGWNALRAPSHAEGMKTAFSSLFVMFYVFFDACFYDNEKKRCVCFFHDECVLPPSSRKISIPALTSLSDHLNLLSKR